MIIRRSRRLHVAVTDYEFIEASAEIEFDEKEADGDVEQWADNYLTYLLETEVEEAAKVTTRRRSFIDQYRYTDTETETETDTESDRK